jgi:hypothetical protein
VPYVAWLHVLNAFAIFVFAFETGRAASVTATTPADPVAV